jgi:hypothetical protein
MSDDDLRPAGPSDPWPTGRSTVPDAFDLLGNEIASLLRSTNEITERTRREAAEDAKARLAAADEQARALVAAADEQARARLAEADHEVQARRGELDDRLAATVRREEAAAAVFDLAAELVDRLERRVQRLAAESQGATDEIGPLRAALRRGTGDESTPESTPEATPEPAVAPGAGNTPEVIDLRDESAPADEQLPKRKGKNKRRRHRERA